MPYLPDIVAIDLKELPPASGDRDPEFEVHGFVDAVRFHEGDVRPEEFSGLHGSQGWPVHPPELDADHHPAVEHPDNIAKGPREVHHPPGEHMGGKGLEDQERLEFEQAGACPDHPAPPGELPALPARVLPPPGH